MRPTNQQQQSSSPSSRGQPAAAAAAAAAQLQNKKAQRRKPFGYSIVQKVNPWYCLLFIACMWGYAWYNGRLLHNLIGSESSVEVVRVVDGDTFVGKTVPGGLTARFRLRQVDAPEYDQPFGAQATRRLEDLLSGADKEVIVFLWEQDSWGRYVVDVVTRDAVFTRLVYVQEELIKSGLAWHFGGFNRETALGEFMQEAKERKVGLWQHPSPVEPWLHRRQRRAQRKAPKRDKRRGQDDDDDEGQDDTTMGRRRGLRGGGGGGHGNSRGGGDARGGRANNHNKMRRGPSPRY